VLPELGQNVTCGDCIRPEPALSLEDPRRLVEGYVDYNNVRLNSEVGYITPKDMLARRQQDIHAYRDRKLEAARKQRQRPTGAATQAGARARGRTRGRYDGETTG
jgi:hypothetical protein